MYGKHFSTMYTGSMVGAGFGAYALMGYVISNQQPDKVVGFQVELNPMLLATIFGEERGTIERAIEYLCAPDPNSRTLAEGGRRLVRVGQFAYRVVNGVVYNKIRNHEQRREQNRVAQQKFRERKKIKSTPLTGETSALAAAAAGHPETAEAIAAERKTVVTTEDREPAWMTIAKNEEQQARVPRAGDAKEDEDVPF
jgi:hypothetical protein